MKRNQENNKKTKEDLIMSIPEQIDVQNVVTPSIEKDSCVQQASTNVRFVTNLATSTASVTRTKRVYIIKEGHLVHPKHIC